MKHIHLIPADFEYYNLDDLIEERDGANGGVCWSNGRKNGKDAQDFNIGDTVYIYFHDDRGLTDRILLKATVCKSDSTDDGSGGDDQKRYLYSEYCRRVLENGKELELEEIKQKSQDAKLNIKGFYLNNFIAISEKYKNCFKYIHGTREEEKQGLTGIMGVRINRTKVYLDKQNDNKYEELKNALGAKGVFNNRSIESLRDEYNNDSCVACTKFELGKHTFQKQNNLYYFEVHHILQRNLNNRKDNFSWFDDNKYIEHGKNKLIYNDYNEVRLCPYHHRLLEHGKYEDRKIVLDKLMKHQNYEDELKKIVKNEKDCNDIIEYIYKQYGLEFK